MSKFYNLKTIALLVPAIGCTFSAMAVLSPGLQWYEGSWYNSSPLEQKAGFLEWQPLEAEFYQDENIMSHVYFTYDDDGFITQRVKKNAQGEYDEKLTFVRNTDHHITEMVVYSYDQKWIPVTKYTYAYDEKMVGYYTTIEIRNWNTSGYWGDLHYNSSWRVIERDTLGRPVTITVYSDVNRHISYKYEFTYADNNSVSFPETYRYSITNGAYTQFLPQTEYRNLQWEGEPTGDEIQDFVNSGYPFDLAKGTALRHYESWNVRNGANELSGMYDIDKTDEGYNFYYTKPGGSRTLNRQFVRVSEEECSGYDDINGFNNDGVPVNMKRYREDHLGCVLSDSYLYRPSADEDWRKGDGYVYEYQYADDRSHALEVKRYYADDSSFVKWTFSDFAHFERNSGVDGIVSENNNEEVRYYNLQGLVISRPIKGSVCIKVENGKVSKVLE